MKTYDINAVSIIDNKFVTQIASNTERTKHGISLSSISIQSTAKDTGEVGGFM